MDPADFEASYHSISLMDIRLGLIGMANITRYISGWPANPPKALKPGQSPPPPNDKEYAAVMSRLATHLGYRGVGQIPQAFYFTNDDPWVDRKEVFYKMTLRRAYEGRASPDEIRDAVRIAAIIGQIRFPVDASAYAQKWFGIDCNSFVSNYLGISPYISIAGFAKGYPGTKPIPGATNDIYPCRGLLPFPPVTEIDAIETGTVLATYGDEDGNHNRWRHVGLVQEFTPVLSVGGARTKGDLVIAEWGGAGSSSAHITPRKTVQLIEFKCPELLGRPCLAIKCGKEADGSPPRYGKDSVRMFLDTRRLRSFASRGWHITNAAGALTYETS